MTIDDFRMSNGKGGGTGEAIFSCLTAVYIYNVLPKSHPEMPAPPTDLESLLADLRAALEDLYGDRLVRLVLYGSQARGDTHEESDVDVLVVLEGPVEPGREVRRMGGVRARVGLQYERPVSLLPVSEHAYRKKSSAWLRSARREGRIV